jgi:hypothetical protein
MKQFKQVFIILLLAVPVICLSVSCKKPKNPKAIITVQNMNSDKLVNATVTVYSSPNGSVIREDLKTNDAGQALFEIENECILNVKATYTLNQQNLQGFGLIILKEGETYYETVTVN